MPNPFSCYYIPVLLTPVLNLGRERRTRINGLIKAPEVRLIGKDGENLGVLPIKEALKKADEVELDLIEISPNANPPVAKIMDYGKYQYEEQKKAREVKAKSHSTETKVVQVKIGTGEHDLALKARRASTWLEEGHRVKLELYLVGRSKYLDRNFLEKRMERFLKLITVEYKVAEKPQKGPKGLYMVLEHA